jgi:hypothetical protein
MKRLFISILAVGLFAVPQVHGQLGWTLAQCVAKYGPATPDDSPRKYSFTTANYKLDVELSKKGLVDDVYYSASSAGADLDLATIDSPEIASWRGPDETDPKVLTQSSEQYLGFTWKECKELEDRKSGDYVTYIGYKKGKPALELVLYVYRTGRSDIHCYPITASELAQEIKDFNEAE